MAYQQGDLITIAEINQFILDLNQVFGTVDHGTPDNTFNYGISPALTLDDKMVGDIVDSAEWTAMLETLRRCADHQGTIITTPSLVTTGDLIEPLAALQADITSVRTNRLVVDPAELQMTADKVAKTRVGAWQNQLTQTISITFGSYDNARYYFNSGGDFRLNFSRTGGSVSDINDTWTAFMNDIGVVKFNWDKAESLENFRNNIDIGFYELTPVLQTVYEATPVDMGGGYYGTESFNIKARMNADVLQFEINWITGDAENDIIDGTMASDLDEFKSSGEIPYAGNIPTYVSTELTGT